MKQLSTKALAKDPSNYEGCKVEKHEQVPIEVMLADDQLGRPTMVSNPADEITSKKRVEKRKMLEKHLSENTVKMNKIKKTNKL